MENKLRRYNFIKNPFKATNERAKSILQRNKKQFLKSTTQENEKLEQNVLYNTTGYRYMFL